MKDAHFYVYNVGHGVCTLLTGKKNNGEPYCGIFDCGTKVGFGHNIPREVISDMIKKIHQNRSTQIDDVVISHQDADHWSMLLGLFSMINDANVNFSPNKYDYSFGMWQEQAWRLTGGVGYCSLFSLKNDNYTKTCYSEYGEYTITVVYNGDSLARMRINTYQGSSSSSAELCSVEGGTCTVVLSFPEESINESVEVNWNPGQSCPLSWFAKGIIKIIDELPIKPQAKGLLKSAFSDMAESFDCNVREKNNMFIEECTQIKIPIINITFGGDMISPEYVGLISLFEAINNVCPSIANVSRYHCGAYIIMTEKDCCKFKKSFPCTDLKPDNYDGKKLNIKRNLTSVVLQFNINDNDILLLPGDATIHTFPEIIKQIDGVSLGSLKLFLAPHHGSDETNINTDDVDIRNGHPLELLFKILQKNGCNLVVSASCSFESHPGKQFIRKARELLSEEKDIHQYAYGKHEQFSIADEETILRDRKRIYTTNCMAELCFDYKDGEVNGKIVGLPIMPVFIYNAKRKLPLDDTFI